MHQGGAADFRGKQMEKVPQTQYCLHFKAGPGLRGDSQDAAGLIKLVPVTHRTHSGGRHKKEKKNTS